MIIVGINFFLVTVVNFNCGIVFVSCYIFPFRQNFSADGNPSGKSEKCFLLINLELTIE